LRSFIASGLGGLYLTQGVELTDRTSRWGIAGPFIAALGLLTLGFVLKEGRKRPLLFLRPFNSLVNELAMNAIAGRLGSTFSAVALDDGSIPAPRSSFGDVFVGLFFFFPTGLLLLLFSAVTLPNEIDKLRNPELETFWASLPAVIACYFGIAAIRKAFRSLVPKSNKIEIKNDKQLSIGISRVSKLSTWLPRMFLPRSLIIQSSDEYWKKAVEGIAKKCEIAVIDLSRMSDSMSWEIDYLSRRMKGKFVIIAEENADVPISEISRDIQRIRYKGDPSQGRAFTNELRKCLSSM
jgi:hypothetical protein